MSDEKNVGKPIVGFLKESLCLGGTERSAANISRLLEKDYELHFILFNGSDIKYPYGGSLIDLKAPPKRSLLGKVLNSLIRYLKVKRTVSRKKIDVLYEFISVENPLSRASYKNVKRITSARDFGKMQRKTDLFYKSLCKADAMICNSDYIRSYYLSKHPEHEGRVFTVYNIIDGDEIARQSTEETEAEYRSFLKKHRKTVSVVGRFCKEKGFEYLLEAFAQVAEKADLGLVMVGDGAYRDKYQRIIRERRLEDRVYFTGFQSNPYKYVAGSDFFVLSSLSEGFPNVLAEAMSLGKPVIAVNCYSGPAEILRRDCDYEAVTEGMTDCDYGILTPRINEEQPQGALEALAKAMERMATEETLAQAYAALSKQRAMEFSPACIAGRFDKILDGLTHKNGQAKHFKKQ